MVTIMKSNFLSQSHSKNEYRKQNILIKANLVLKWIAGSEKKLKEFDYDSKLRLSH